MGAKSARKEEGPELYFVQLTENSKIRRNILESLKQILEFSHSYEKLKVLAHQKLDHSNRLKQSIREINKMVFDLRQKLPQANVRLETEKQKESIKPTPIQKTNTELDRLSGELRAVEEKLRRLG